MHIRRLAAAAVTGLAAGALALAGTAQADVQPVEPWQALDSGTHAAADSHIVDPWTANLVVDADNTNAGLGTSLETTNLGIEIADDTEITFEYESLEGADCNDGANVRVFVIIDGTQTNSWDQMQPAGEQCGENGQVSFTVEAGGTIEHAGLVYDNDPPEPGVIQFRNLTIGGEPVMFAEKPDPTDRKPLTIDVTLGDDCGAEVAYTNPNDFAFWGDYRIGDQEGMEDSEYETSPPSVNDEGYPDELRDGHDHGVTPDQELTQGDWAGSGETFGKQYNPALIPAGETRTVKIEVDETTEIQARIWRGPNQSVYVPWTDPVEVEACEDPKPDPTEDPGAGGGDLPETSGLNVPVMLGGGALALGGVGGLLTWLGRRRRPQVGLPE